MAATFELLDGGDIPVDPHEELVIYLPGEGARDVAVKLARPAQGSRLTGSASMWLDAPVTRRPVTRACPVYPSRSGARSRVRSYVLVSQCDSTGKPKHI
jgi:hypothetical protein